MTANQFLLDYETFTLRFYHTTRISRFQGFSGMIDVDDLVLMTIVSTIAYDHEYCLNQGP